MFRSWGRVPTVVLAVLLALGAAVPARAHTIGEVIDARPRRRLPGRRRAPARRGRRRRSMPPASVTSADPVSGTITLGDGRVRRTTDRTIVYQPTRCRRSGRATRRSCAAPRR
jgi:hypothetical protein